MYRTPFTSWHTHTHTQQSNWVWEVQSRTAETNPTDSAFNLNMTWASVSIDLLLWYSEYITEPVIYYFTGVNKLNQYFCFTPACEHLLEDRLLRQGPARSCWPTLDLWPHRCDVFLVSYLPLCSLDGRGFEEEGIVWLVVVVVGGGEDDLLQSGVIPADVVWRARHEAAMMAARRQRRPWDTKTTSETMLTDFTQELDFNSRTGL